MNCFSRVCMNTLVVGFAAALVFGLVKLARTPHSAGSIVILSIFLVFWLGFGASFYPAFCGSLFSWSALGRCLERSVSAVLWILCLPSRCARAVRRQRRRRRWVAAVRDAERRVHHQRASPRAAGVRRSAASGSGWRRRWDPGVRAAGRRRVAGLHGVPPPFNFFGYGQAVIDDHQNMQNNNAQLANQAQVNWPAWNNNAPNVAPAVHPEEEVVAQNVIPDLNNAAEVADGEDFIPLPVLNQQEEEELAEIDNLANPEIQMAIALNIPAAVAQQAQEHSSYTDSVSFPSSNTSSVNMDIPEDQLDLALGLPAIQPVQPQQQPSPENFLADEIQEDDLLPEN
ncbi:unnamed protein product [Urochloa humidicola]